jgi:hypothetical protein
MASKRTTHELATLLAEVVEALRQMPDMSLSEIQPQRARKVKSAVDTTELASKLPQMERDEAIARLEELGQGELIQLCRQLKLKLGSKRTKKSLVNQILWQLFESKDQLERIRTYEEKSHQKH